MPRSDEQLLESALALRTDRGARLAGGIRKLVSLKADHALRRAALEREVLRRSARLDRAQRALPPDSRATTHALVAFIDAEESLEECVHGAEKLRRQREYCVSCLLAEEGAF
jgi:hypothetical protein